MEDESVNEKDSEFLILWLCLSSAIRPGESLSGPVIPETAAKFYDPGVPVSENSTLINEEEPAAYRVVFDTLALSLS